KTSGGERRRIVSAGLYRGLSMGECGDFIRLVQSAAQIAHLVAPGSSGLCRWIIRLQCERLVEEGECLIRLARHRDISVWQGPQIEIVGVETFRALAPGALDLGVAQARLDRADDAQGNLVLQFEDVVERAVISLGPDMRAGRGLDQLRGDTDPVRGFS